MSGPTTIPGLLLARAASSEVILRRKDRGIWQSVTWRALADRAGAIGGGLLAVGFGPGAVGAVLADISADWVAIDLAIQGAGGASLALDPSGGAASTAAQLAASGCRVLFVENEEQLDKVLGVRAHCPALALVVIMDMKGLRDFADPGCMALEAFLADGRTWLARAAEVGPDSVGVLAASMGEGRLVPLRQSALMVQARGIAELVGLRPGDDRLAFQPPSLVAERVFGLYAALHAGTITNIVESSETVPENLAELRPTVMFAIPRVWEKLHAAVAVGTAGATWLQRALYRWAIAGGGGKLGDLLVLRPLRRAIGLDRLRLAFSGAAPVSPELVRWYRALGIELRDVYGVAECGGVAAISPGGVVPWGEVSLDEAGEVRVRGPHASAEGWIATGDLGRVEEGGLALTGRVGEALEVDGQAVMPAAFENAVKLSPYIADAVLVGGPGGLGCLVMLEFDAVEAWAQAQNLVAGSAAALARAEPVRALVAAEIAARAPGLRLAGFRILERRIAPEDPEVTATMRLRRAYVLREYAGLIEEMYRPA